MLSGSVMSDRRILGRALAASLVLHLLLALAIPALAIRSGTRPEPETIAFEHLNRILIEQPRRPARLVPRVTAVRPREVTVAVRHIAPARPAAPAVSVPAPNAISVPAPQAPAAPAGLTQPAAQRPVAVAQASASPAPTATAPPSPREVANVAHPPNGYMPFGAEERDPVLDPDVRKQIAALGIHATIVIAVSDEGRTKTVVFQTPVSRDLQNEIENLLADAAYDPAYCGGGIPCAGQLTLKI